MDNKPSDARQAEELKAIVAILDDSLTALGVDQWLHGRNRYLDGARPIDLLRSGHFDSVQKAAHAFSEGYYV